MVTRVIDVAVAGRDVVVELVPSHAHQRVGEGLYVERRLVLGIVVGDPTLEAAAGVDGLEKGLAVGVLAIGRTAGSPQVPADNDAGMARNRVMPVKDEGLSIFISSTMKSPFSTVDSVYLRIKVKTYCAI